MRPNQSRRSCGPAHPGAILSLPTYSRPPRCCVAVNRSQYNLKGEWFHRPGEALIKEGGHSIAIVGWNDHYRTESGLQGGWVIRNSWEDGTCTACALRAHCVRTACALCCHACYTTSHRHRAPRAQASAWPTALRCAAPARSTGSCSATRTSTRPQSAPTAATRACGTRARTWPLARRPRRRCSQSRRTRCVQPPPRAVAASTKYGCSLCDVRLQPW